jgi:hypothetical protein
MRLQLVMSGFLLALACPLVAYAQYDIVPGSIRVDQLTLNNGLSLQREIFQISPTRVVHYKRYIATLIRDDGTGLLWFTFEGTEDIQKTQPGNGWRMAKSTDDRSLVGFQAGSSKLILRVSTRTSGSIDSALALAMTELSGEIAAHEAALAIPPREIDLNPHLDLSTFSGASGLSERDMKRVTAIDDGWVIELASHPSLGKTAFVYLSQDFRVLKVDVRKN